MDSWTRTYLGSLLVVLTLIGVVPAQDGVLDSTINDLDLTDVVVDVESNADLADTTAPANDVVRVVRLKSDGVLEGRVSIIQATGKRLPADAEVKFERGGELINGAKTNSDGQFEVDGITPGTYTATAMIETGSADFSVNVLPYDENAGPEQMILDATLTPTPEPQIYEEGIVSSTCEGCGVAMDAGYVDGGYIEGGIVDGGIIEGGYCDSCSMGSEVIVGEEFIDPGFAAAPCSMGASCGGGGFSGGGGCCGGGGGRGLGWLLGAGGLAAGITAIALNDDDDPASPAGP